MTPLTSCHDIQSGWTTKRAPLAMGVGQEGGEEGRGGGHRKSSNRCNTSPGYRGNVISNPTCSRADWAAFRWLQGVAMATQREWRTKSNQSFYFHYEGLILTSEIVLKTCVQCKSTQQKNRQKNHTVYNYMHFYNIHIIQSYYIQKWQAMKQPKNKHLG